jgi:hypothetical protein
MLSVPLEASFVWELSIMLALMAATLIISSELLMFYYGKVDARLNKKRLNQAALLVTGLFFATIALKVAGLLLNS